MYFSEIKKERCGGGCPQEITGRHHGADCAGRRLADVGRTFETRVIPGQKQVEVLTYTLLQMEKRIGDGALKVKKTESVTVMMI